MNHGNTLRYILRGAALKAAFFIVLKYNKK